MRTTNLIEVQNKSSSMMILIQFQKDSEIQNLGREMSLLESFMKKKNDQKVSNLFQSQLCQNLLKKSQRYNNQRLNNLRLRNPNQWRNLLFKNPNLKKKRKFQKQLLKILQFKDKIQDQNNSNFRTQELLLKKQCISKIARVNIQSLLILPQLMIQNQKRATTLQFNSNLGTQSSRETLMLSNSMINN